MDIIFTASIIASFFAGMVALFAPCCISILLPTYMASALKQNKNILKMTFMFFAGIAVILIPIGLGAASLAKVFQSFHKELYIFGGLLMIVLGILAILGKGASILPMPKMSLAPTGASQPKSAFLLGIFSGAATSCCAPVLFGAITLAVVSGVFWKALIVTFAYVFGMTIPLFVAAYFYDRFKVENSKFIRGKLFEIKLGTKTFFIHSTNLIAGIVFLTMGIIILILAFSGNTFWSPVFQTGIGESLNSWSQKSLEFFMKAPDFFWGIIIIGFFLFFIYKMRKKSDNNENESK